MKYIWVVLVVFLMFGCSDTNGAEYDYKRHYVKILNIEDYVEIWLYPPNSKYCPFCWTVIFPLGITDPKGNVSGARYQRDFATEKELRDFLKTWQNSWLRHYRKKYAKYISTKNHFFIELEDDSFAWMNVIDPYNRTHNKSDEYYSFARMIGDEIYKEPIGNGRYKVWIPNEYRYLQEKRTKEK